MIPTEEHLKNFEKALSDLINNYSMEETFGNIPDFILAEYIMGCLYNFS